jgi:CheY-like chemotaxis protein
VTCPICGGTALNAAVFTEPAEHPKCRAILSASNLARTGRPSSTCIVGVRDRLESDKWGAVGSQSKQSGPCQPGNFVPELVGRVDAEPERLGFDILAFGFTARGSGVCLEGMPGLSLALSTSPDVILLDMLLPKLSSVKVLLALKSNRATERIPVIALSSCPAPMKRG